MTRLPLDTALSQRLILFDGAMGTELYARHQFVNVCFEELCLSRPALVQDVHESMRDAGADVLTTNSFAANRLKLSGYLLPDEAERIATAAAELARKVAREDHWVAGSVGPLGVRPGGPGLPDEEAVEIFMEPIRGLMLGGADFILFETFSRREELTSAMEAALRLNAPFAVSLALSGPGFTRHGETVEEVIRAVSALSVKPLFLGFNCGLGPKEMLEAVEPLASGLPYPLVVQPNAGAPRLVNDRMISMTSPEYMATYAMHFAQIGARGIGGCCGTAPDHIRELANSVRAVHKEHVVLLPGGKKGAAPQSPVPLPERSRWARKLSEGTWVQSVELLPPLGWDLAATLARARQCGQAGVDAINLPDGPRASARLSPLVTAIRLQAETGLEAVLHLTCRDRNVIGMQSDLLGCAAAGVNNLLIITGDPPKLGDYPFASAVFDIDSIGLTRIASNLNRGLDIAGMGVNPPTRFCIGVGADPTHLDQEREVERFFRKAEAGAEFAITQPVYEPDRLLRFLERVKPAGLPILAGIWPLASLRNAEFLRNEVPGVTIPDWVIERMRAHSTKEAQQKEGVAIARDILSQVRPMVAGVQVSVPFGNVSLALEVIS